jgi:hypothetical protein
MNRHGARQMADEDQVGSRRVWAMILLATVVATVSAAVAGKTMLRFLSASSQATQTGWAQAFYPDQFASGQTVGGDPRHDDCLAIQAAINAASAPSSSNPSVPRGHVQLRPTTTYYCFAGDQLVLRNHTYISGARDHTSVIEFKGTVGNYITNDTRGKSLPVDTRAGSTVVVALHGSFSPADVGHPIWVSDRSRPHGGFITTIVAQAGASATLAAPVQSTQTDVTAATTRGNTDIRLRNFVLRGGGNGRPAGPNSILRPNLSLGISLRYVRRFTISNVWISDIPRLGIAYFGSHDGAITNCWVHNTGRDGITGFGLIDNLRNISITDNRIYRTGDDAIAVDGTQRPFTGTHTAPVIYFRSDGLAADNIHIVGNTIREWQANVKGRMLGRDIYVQGLTGGTIENNRLSYSFGSGIEVEGGYTATSSMPDGAPLLSSHLTISGNTIDHAGWTYPGSIVGVTVAKDVAVRIDDLTDSLIAHNTSTQSRVGGSSVTDCSRCTWIADSLK